MRPLFLAERVDGKTDFIYEADFKNGKFVGGASKYSYDDLYLMHLPSDILKEVFSQKKAQKIENIDIVE